MTYKYGSDARLAVKNLRPTNIELPEDPAVNATTMECRMWEKEVDEAVRRRAYFKENLKTIYSLVWGQCTDALCAKLEGLETHETLAQRGDSLGLLQVIKGVVYNFQDQKYQQQSLDDATRHFYTMYQGKYTTTQAFLEQFQNVVDDIDHCGATIGNHAAGIAAVYESAGIDPDFTDECEREAAQMEAKSRYLATAFILHANRTRYRHLVEDLENDYLQGNDNFPKSLMAAYNLLANWKQDPRHIARIRALSNSRLRPDFQKESI